jgi:xanthine dehydrogenase FAD-binding subunit
MPCWNSQDRKASGRCPSEAFSLGPGKVDIKPFELLTAICIPRRVTRVTMGFYSKYSMREAMDIASPQAAA